MKELFLKMESGNVPICKEQIEKYHLKPGSISPFNRYHVVDINGEENTEPLKDKKPAYHSEDDMLSDGILFTTSEVLDLAQGADS